MPEFLTLTPPGEALARLLAHVAPTPRPETVTLSEAVGRVTAAPIVAPHPLPPFNRSAVDGYAVLSADTYGASESLPAYLQVIGELPMGKAPPFDIGRGQCALIHTGGMLPASADAVVMLEYTQTARPGEVEILRAVANGENVLKSGEDVAANEIVIPAGKRLRPEEIGGLAALGLTNLTVARPPQVAIVSTGDEIVPPDSEPLPAQVRDVNSYTLSALIQSLGGQPIRYGIIADQFEALRGVAARALDECDALIITAGSSASTRDLTAQVISELGRPGVLVHGINIRPGKPTILAVCEEKAVIGLPGNPVSALVIARLFVTPLIQRLLGLQEKRPSATTYARLTVNIPSQAGREDWVAVRLVHTAGEYHAEPIFGKSNLIFTLVRADGLVCIPTDATGLSAGEIVAVQVV